MKKWKTAVRAQDMQLSGLDTTEMDNEGSAEASDADQKRSQIRADVLYLFTDMLYLIFFLEDSHPQWPASLLFHLIEKKIYMEWAF